MPVTVIIGLQWGDEGKGRVIDARAGDVDICARFHGGPNAGHTIVLGDKKYVFHLVPDGIINRSVVCLITNGVVIDPTVLLGEISGLENGGIIVKNRLWISPRCHLIMPYHKVLDSLLEEAKGKGKTGTTGRGIGPVNSDKVSYNGLRIFDLLKPAVFAEKLRVQLEIKNRLITALGGSPFDFQEVLEQYIAVAAALSPYIKETQPILYRAWKDGKKILFGGAHGFYLDNELGTYPFCSASAVVPGAINEYAGIPTFPDTVVGVVKAYTTRVGGGPFPTEVVGPVGDLLRERGGEYGATTNRPRRCGWFDGELTSKAAMITGTTQIALTKIDVLDTLPEIPICTGYQLNGRQLDSRELDAIDLGQVEPIFEIMPGWQKETRNIRRLSDLLYATRRYISRLEELIGVPILQISVGPERKEMIDVRG